MDEFQNSLDALLHQYFQVTEMYTNRQDQWYKRSLQAWMAARGGSHAPLILSPKDSRSDWAPALARLSKQFAGQIRIAAAEERGRQITPHTLSKDKLFPDSVVNSPIYGWTSKLHEDSPLSLRMQRLEFWTTSGTELQKANAVKALLEAGQLAPLLYLARVRGANMKQIATIMDKNRYTIVRQNQGWQSLIEQLLNFTFFLGIMCSLPDDLVTERQYLLWAPYASKFSAFISYYRTDGSEHYMKLFDEEPIGGRPIPSIQHLKGFKDWCLQRLVYTSVLCAECGLDEVDWESRIIDAALYFFGFEAWNRSREGEGYLGCDRNVTKDSKWLKAQLSQGDLQELNESSSSIHMVKSSKPIDPLRLRDAKKEPEPEQMDPEQADRLAALEEEEVAYGIRRSEKYRAKKRQIDD